MQRVKDHSARWVRPLSTAQLAGSACIDCASTEQPLHPGETITVPIAEGVVRDVVTALCTGCLLTARDTVILATSSPEARQ